MPVRKSRKPAGKGRTGERRTGARPTGSDRALREHVIYLLKGGGAHLDFEKAIAGLPAEHRGLTAAGLPFTAWRLLEHLRIAQWDITEFSRSPKHASPAWPTGYWPQSDAPPNDEAWERSVAEFRSGLKGMQRLVSNPKTDLYARIPHGDGQTVLREALLLADHNAYHLGQLVLLRRLLGSWHD